MAQLDKTFPTLDCAACILTPKMVDAAQNEKIQHHLPTPRLKSVSGFVGNFTAKIRKKARYVDEDKCTGCGLCTEKCPSRKGLNEFNMGLNNRGAIYIPFAQAIPNVAVIDPDAVHACSKPASAACAKRSAPRAPSTTSSRMRSSSEKYGAIVVATGFKPIDAGAFDEYRLLPEPRTWSPRLEFERLMNAAGPTKGMLAASVRRAASARRSCSSSAWARRCSKDAVKGKAYCSKICCMYTAKHAMLVREKYPDIKVHVFYIDVRTPGKNFDEFYRRAVEQYGVDYIKGHGRQGLASRTASLHGSGQRPDRQRAGAYRLRTWWCWPPPSSRIRLRARSAPC